MFKPPLARVTPVKPPTVNKKIKPRANNNAVLRQRLAPHKVAKDFDSCRYRDNHGGCREISSRIDIHTNSEHMMSSYDKTKKPNGKHSVDHTEITENGWMAVPRYDMR
jgi:hypothetical protein